MKTFLLAWAAAVIAFSPAQVVRPEEPFVYDHCFGPYPSARLTLDARVIGPEMSFLRGTYDPLSLDAGISSEYAEELFSMYLRELPSFHHFELRLWEIACHI
jgi:hypothetical protein